MGRKFNVLATALLLAVLLCEIGIIAYRICEGRNEEKVEERQTEENEQRNRFLLYYMCIFCR
jgi:hypothetical protein